MRRGPQCGICTARRSRCWRAPRHAPVLPVAEARAGRRCSPSRACSAPSAGRSSGASPHPASRSSRASGRGCSPRRRPRSPGAIGRHPAGRTSAERSASPRIAAARRRSVSARYRDLERRVRGVRGDRFLEVVESDGVSRRERPISRPAHQLLRKTVDQRGSCLVGSPGAPQPPAPTGSCAGRSPASAVGRGRAPVELVLPQHRLRLGRIDPDVKDRVAVLHVVDTAWLAVATERLLQRLARRCRAEPRIAIEMVRPDPATRHERQRVVVLEEELPARLEPQRTIAPPSSSSSRERLTTISIASSQLASPSSPPRRTSGRSRRSVHSFACQP